MPIDGVLNVAVIRRSTFDAGPGRLSALAEVDIVRRGGALQPRTLDLPSATAMMHIDSAASIIG